MHGVGSGARNGFVEPGFTEPGLNIILFQHLDRELALEGRVADLQRRGVRARRDRGVVLRLRLVELPPEALEAGGRLALQLRDRLPPVVADRDDRRLRRDVAQVDVDAGAVGRVLAGEVLDAEIGQGSPLLYYRRGYHELQ